MILLWGIKILNGLNKLKILRPGSADVEEIKTTDDLESAEEQLKQFKNRLDILAEVVNIDNVEQANNFLDQIIETLTTETIETDVNFNMNIISQGQYWWLLVSIIL